jgi:hypothetical protein
VHREEVAEPVSGEERMIERQPLRVVAVDRANQFTPFSDGIGWRELL